MSIEIRELIFLFVAFACIINSINALLGRREIIFLNRMLDAAVDKEISNREILWDKGTGSWHGNREEVKKFLRWRFAEDFGIIANSKRWLRDKYLKTSEAE